MVIAAKVKKNNLKEFVIFILLVILPFGVLLDREVLFGVFQLTIRPLDLVSLMSLVIVISEWNAFKKHKFYLKSFLVAATFSLLASLSFIPLEKVVVGSLYLFRFTAYSSLFFLTKQVIDENLSMKKVILNSLLVISVVAAIFGWVQYLWLPDLRFLKYIGWDDHLFRLVGTFLDPTFMGLILVIGILISFSNTINTKKLISIFVFIFLLITLGLTYSRASYLALFVGFSYYLFKKTRNLIVPLVLLTFLLLIPLLPRPSSEGVKLERTHSIIAKVVNYKETYTVFIKNPLFGVGFNNLCFIREELYADNLNSHSCFGSDSSFLFILATTGIVGFLIFTTAVISVYGDIPRDEFGDVWKATFFAVLVHSQFANSLFYPWTLVYLAILSGVALANKSRD